MTQSPAKKQTIIAPHYHEVQKEFMRLRAKLETALASPANKPMGREIIDPKGALTIWDKSLRKTMSKLPSFFHSFTSTILAKPCRPTRIHTLQAIIPLEQEINYLIALHRQLWQQPLCGKWHEGQELLSRCIEKIIADLADLFSFFISIVEAYASGRKAKYSSYFWDKEISCRLEMAEYKGWRHSMTGPSIVFKKINWLSNTLYELASRLEARCSGFCKA